MSAPTDGGPAFPHPELVQDVCDEEGHVKVHRVYHAQPGMTLRDYFAAMALEGDWAAQGEHTGEWSNDTRVGAMQTRAALYYRMADAMIAAREAKP